MSTSTHQPAAHGTDNSAASASGKRRFRRTRTAISRGGRLIYGLCTLLVVAAVLFAAGYAGYQIGLHKTVPPDLKNATPDFATLCSAQYQPWNDKYQIVTDQGSFFVASNVMNRSGVNPTDHIQMYISQGQIVAIYKDTTAAGRNTTSSGCK